MKTQNSCCKWTKRLRSRKRSGFALVITISMMVLLSLLAIGLLGLSTISVRASSQGEAMQVARSNARLGLAIAIGELQSQLGADQRISAPGALASSGAPKHLAGAWEGALPSVTEPAPEKSDRFLGYLVSGSEEDPVKAPASQGATLMGKGSLGTTADTNDFVYGKTVQIDDPKSDQKGGYAWVALDESVKAKADLVREIPDEVENPTHALVGSAPRFGIEKMTDLEGFDWFEGTDQGLMASLQTSGLIEEMTKLGPYQHDLSVVNMGLLTDSARGGLKKDLSRMVEDLPSDLSKARVYDDPAVASADNNPYWSHIADYANLYKKLETGDGGYRIRADLPTAGGPAYNSREREYNKPQAPKGTPLMPVVAKMQLQFSLVSKDAHGGWGSTWIYQNTQDSQRKYMLYMIYSPIITLYNPYNVPLTFDELRIDFEDVPIGFRFFRNGRPQTTDLAHFNQLYISHDSNSSKAKSFGLNIRNTYSNSRSGAITLAPGEARIFGESVDGNWSWETGRMFDWRDDDMTANVPLAPGYAPGMGFWIDWLTPNEMLTAHDDGMGILSLRSSDTVDVEFAPMPSQSAGNKLSIEIGIVERGRKVRAGLMKLDYSSKEALTDALSGDDETTVYPARLQRPYRTTEIYQRPSDKLRDYARVKPFAVFTFEGKTTLDSASPGKPWVQDAHSSNMVMIDLADEDMGLHTHDVSMRSWRPSNAIEHDPLTNQTYFFTSGSALRGLKSAPQYEVPSLPLQSIAQLRHARLAPQGFMGGASYTAGESFANPLIPAGAVTMDGSRGYTLLDQAWLTNNALWDGYFFSTISDHGGAAMGSSRESDKVAEAFFNGEEKLLNPRLTASSTLEPDEIVSEVTGSEGYLKSAAHLLVDGSFNVNSTSVEAWKALLSSLNNETIEFYDGTGSVTGKGEEGQVEEAINPHSRMRRATGRPVEESKGGIDARRARWNGFRTLDDDQVETLARNIVEQIKQRGPFLSLAEFVNRRPGSDEQEALTGALQAAIDQTSINTDFSEDSQTLGAGDTSGVGYQFPKAMEGMNAAGAPGYLTQGDILSSVGQILTVRADTFRIRAYGEALDSNGKPRARAWCEAVVQRTPEYLDSTDSAEELPTSETNQKFGRRFLVTSFRWLSPEEV